MHEKTVNFCDVELNPSEYRFLVVKRTQIFSTSMEFASFDLAQMKNSTINYREWL